MATWQPISSVKNGDRVLVWAPGRGDCDELTWMVFEAQAYVSGEYYDPVYLEWRGDGATHWMPLPLPPQPEDQSEGSPGHG